MKITGIRIRHVSLGKDRAPIDHAGGGFATWAVVEVLTDEGITGISRVRSQPGEGSLGRIIEATLKPAILGEDPRNPERLWRKMYRLSYHRPAREAHRFVTAVGALDIALWDIVGKAAGLPLYRLWGGYRDRIPLIAGWMYYPVGHDYSKELAIIERYMDEGYSAVKVHLRPDEPAIAVEKVLATQQRIGDDKMLAIDLVEAQWDLFQVAEAIPGLEEAGIAWLEDPFRWDDKLGALAFVSSLTHIPITAGEHESSLHGWRDLLTVGGVKILMLDCLTGGGFSQLNRAAHLAQAFHTKVTTHGSAQPELGAQFVAAHSNCLIHALLPQSAPVQDWAGLYKEPLAVKDGWLDMPQGPGLGMELDEDFIRLHQLD